MTLLDEEALSTQHLERYEAIVIGVRAYNTGRMALHHKRLMDYVAAGGTLVAQYSTRSRLDKLGAPIGPAPFEITQERVTDENAPVTLTAPGHALLNRPNRIGTEDFAGWVQERGLYFAGAFEGRYESVLAMADPGEALKKGSLIVTRHGKGAFIYTGLSFFRQLPAGVPGTYRLFANLLSYGRIGVPRRPGTSARRSLGAGAPGTCWSSACSPPSCCCSAR